MSRFKEAFAKEPGIINARAPRMNGEWGHQCKSQ